MTRWECKHAGPMYDVWTCTACHFELAESRSDNGVKEDISDFRFCPNCGERFEVFSLQWILDEVEL